VLVEALPEFVNRCSCGLGAYVQKNANVGLDERSKSIEEPAVRVEFLLVLLFKAEDDLDGNAASGDFASLADDNLRGVLEDMCGDVFASNRVFRNSFLIATHQRQNVKSPLINFVSSVADYTNDDLLPTFIAPGLALRSTAQMGNVLNHRVHRLDEQDFVFVVHGHDDEELSMPAIEVWAQAVFGRHELVRIACRGGVSHLGHLV